jgi:hypothetical protein
MSREQSLSRDRLTIADMPANASQRLKDAVEGEVVGVVKTEK